MNKPFSIKPMIGLKFGRLLVLSTTTNRSSDGTIIYLCVCDCGTEIQKNGKNLRKGISTSCGCLTKEIQRTKGKTSSLTHGATKNKSMTGTYKSWLAMRRRCFDKKFKDYPRYGGAGITVCDGWSDFSNFLSGMGERPNGMTLDRINNSDGYNPSNCRWANHKMQMNNTTRNRLIEYQGVTHTLSEWADIMGVPRARLSARINGLGWSIEKAFTQLTPEELLHF